MPRLIEFGSLGSADLVVDAIYEGKDSQLASDPISRLLAGCGNMGGFRLAGRRNADMCFAQGVIIVCHVQYKSGLFFS